MDPVWTPQAVIDGAIKHHSVYVAIDRRRMPESNCESIEKDNEDAMRFLFEGNQLQECVQSKYPNIRLDFEKVIIRAESAGARFGLDAWRLYGHRVAAIVCFYGLFRSYSRQPGVYMDKEVSFEEAETSMLKSERLRMRLRGEIPPAIGRATPIFQYAAYYLSVTDVWQDVWDGKSAMDCLDEMSDCPNENTIMLFTHGSADELVSLSSSQEMVKKLKKKWPRLDVKLQSLEGVGHGFDYDDPLHSVRMVGLRDLLEKIFK
jgi:pimeloyl-ACP methyl ester carboxylesterase